MKKLIFLFGVAIGFLLGSKAGPDAYNEVEKKVRSVIDRPEVQDVVEKAKSAAQDQVEQISDKVDEKLPGTKSGARVAGNGAPAGRSSVGVGS